MTSPCEASKILREQLKELYIEGVSAWLVDENDLFEWNVSVSRLRDTPFEGRILNFQMNFPKDYPHSPPAVRFTSDISHPDVGPDGKVFIPILKTPGTDHKPTSGCWSVESIILDIISMLSRPFDGCPVKADVSSSQIEQPAIQNVPIPGKTIAYCDKGAHSMLLKPCAMQFRCDGCNQQGSGPRYICDKCNYELHQECVHPQTTIFPDFFDNLEFRFFDIPQPSESGTDRWCDACGKKIRGLKYQSVDRRYDLHPCCSKLRKMFYSKDLNTDFELRKDTSFRCLWCQEYEVSIGPVKGWEYASSCGRYHFHVYCLMELVHTNASIEEDNYLGLEKIDLKHLAKHQKM